MNKYTEQHEGDRQAEGKYLTSFQRKLLEKSLQEQSSSPYHQRILIMLLADEGKTQNEICKTLNCCPATVRYWVFMARMGLAHQWREHSIGRPKTVNDQYLERLKELVSQSPQDYGYGFRRWTGQWLSKHLTKELGIEVNERHINRLLKQMGLSTRSKLQESENYGDNWQKSRILIQDLSYAVQS